MVVDKLAKEQLPVALPCIRVSDLQRRLQLRHIRRHCLHAAAEQARMLLVVPQNTACTSAFTALLGSITAACYYCWDLAARS
jgi:hypothetical protein